MSDRKDDEQDGKREYSVDEILEEFGSGRGDKPKVVTFPPPEKRPRLEQGKTPTPRPPGQNTLRFTLPGQAGEGSGQKPEARQESARRAQPQGEKQEAKQGEKRAEKQEETQAAKREKQPAKPAASPRTPPEERPRPKPREPQPPPKEEIVRIQPGNPLRRIAALFSAVDRKTDHYADHMYDQAELDEEKRRAQRYIPGVDKEEAPREGRRVKPRKKPRRTRPDVEPAALSKRYAKGLQGKQIRLMFALVLAMLCAVASLLDIAVLPLAAILPAGLDPDAARLATLLGLLILTGLLCAEVTFGGLLQLVTLRPGPESVLSLAFFATVADGAALIYSRSRAGLPCCAVTALGLALGMWGHRARRQGDRISARTAAQVKAPFVVTLDEGKWSGRPAYAKWVGTQEGFGSQLQGEDGVHRAYFAAAPLLIIGCFVCAGMSGAKGGVYQFLWTLSATLTAAAAWSAPLVYSLPYQRLARRLFDVGAALAGWPGVARCRKSGILMGDNDFFPTGTVKVTGVRVFGGVANEKAVSYTATLLRVLGSGLAKPFQELVRANGTFYREVSGVRFHEGGVTGIIREYEVFVGTADFMRLMDVALPEGLNVKRAVFCAINGELAGIFALKYSMGQTVRPCLAALMDAGVRPIVATRDPNLIPGFLGEKFKLPVDRMEFPPVDRRLQLSDPDQDHDDVPVALLSREGVAPFCDAVVGGKRLRSAVYLGTAFTLTGSVMGVALTFYLTYLGAAASLTVSAFLLFMAFWLVPALLIDLWVDRY